MKGHEKYCWVHIMADDRGPACPQVHLYLVYFFQMLFYFTFYFFYFYVIISGIINLRLFSCISNHGAVTTIVENRCVKAQKKIIICLDKLHIGC